MLAAQHFVGSLLDQAGNVGGQIAVTVVDPCSGFLDQGQSVQYRQRHAFLTNGEVDQRALRLSTPVGVVRDFDLAQAVGFDTAHRAHSCWSVCAV
ncbi:hypothetical protein D3C81_1428660 [compost metagenome]